MSFDITFQTAFNCIINGPTGSGKTTWLKNLLKLKKVLFDVEPKAIFLYYNMMQPIYVELKNEGLVDEIINVAASFPTLEDVTAKVHKFKDDGGSLIVFDDMITQLTPDFERIFCNLSHHENASVILMTQNLFYNDKIYRTISLNAHYFVLMKNDRDKQQISILAKQICPGNSRYIITAYEDATKRPYSYLITDFRANTPPSIKLRSNIFPTELPVVVYLEK